MGGLDFDIGLLVDLRRIIEEECIFGLRSVERGGALMHTYFQMLWKGNFSSLPVLNQKIKICLGRNECPLTSHALSCKRLRDKGLHTFLGIVGFCLKDNVEEHFEFVHHNVSMDNMNEVKWSMQSLGRCEPFT